MTLGTPLSHSAGAISRREKRVLVGPGAEGQGEGHVKQAFWNSPHPAASPQWLKR